MTMPAMLFMALSWGAMLSLLVWSFRKILRGDAARKRGGSDET